MKCYGCGISRSPFVTEGLREPGAISLQSQTSGGGVGFWDYYGIEKKVKS